MQVPENTADPTGLQTVLTQSIAVSASNVAEIIVKRLLCCFISFRLSARCFFGVKKREAHGQMTAFIEAEKTDARLLFSLRCIWIAFPASPRAQPDGKVLAARTAVSLLI